MPQTNRLEAVSIAKIKKSETHVEILIIPNCFVTTVWVKIASTHVWAVITDEKWFILFVLYLPNLRNR